MAYIICDVCKDKLDLYADEYYKGYYSKKGTDKNETFGTGNVIIVCMKCVGGNDEN